MKKSLSKYNITLPVNHQAHGDIVVNYKHPPIGFDS